MSKRSPQSMIDESKATNVLLKKLNNSIHILMRERSWSEFKQADTLETILGLVKSSSQRENQDKIQKKLCNELHDKLSATIGELLQEVKATFLKELDKKVYELLDSIHNKSSTIKYETPPPIKKQKTSSIITETKPKSYVENLDFVESFTPKKKNNADSISSSSSTTQFVGYKYTAAYKKKKGVTNLDKEVINLFSSDSSTTSSDYKSHCSPIKKAIKSIVVNPYKNKTFISARRLKEIQDSLDEKKIKKEQDEIITVKD